MRSFEEFSGGLQRSLARGLGAMAASYRLCLSKAYAQAVAQARTAEEIQFLANWMATFAHILWYAIGATRELTHLIVPNVFEDLYIERPINRSKNGVLFIRFAGWCCPGFDIDTRNIQYILNVEVRRLCAQYGLPCIRVHVQRRERNRILFALALDSDVTRVRGVANVGTLKL